MPFTPFLDRALLDAVFGGTAYVAPATVYVGLILQAATVQTTPLTAGTSYTTITCSALAYALAAGDELILGSGTATQTVTVGAAGAAAGATSIPVTSFIANANYGVGTALTKATYVTGIEPSGSNYARVAVPNDGTHWSAATGGAPAQKQNATQINFPQLSGAIATCSGVVLADNPTPGSGNVLAIGVLNAPQTFAQNNTPGIGPQQMTITQH